MHEPREPMSAAGALSALQRISGPDASRSRYTLLINGVGVILLASVLLGAVAVLVRLASRDLSGSQIAFVRFFGSLPLLLVVGRKRLLPNPSNLGRVLCRGLLGAAAIVLYYRAIAMAGAAPATLLTSTYPVFATLFATLVGERFHTRLAYALVLNLLGLIVVVYPASALGTSVLWGMISALAASVLLGGTVVMARQLRASETALVLTTYFMAVGAALTSPVLLVHFPPLSSALLVTLAAMVVTSVGAQLLLDQGLGFTSASRGSLAAAISVVTAAVLESVCLGAHLTWKTIVGACLMLTAVALGSTSAD